MTRAHIRISFDYFGPSTFELFFSDAESYGFSNWTRFIYQSPVICFIDGLLSDEAFDSIMTQVINLS